MGFPDADARFARVTEFPRGTLLALLRDGYSFEPKYEEHWLDEWRAFDDFFYDNPRIADKYGLVTAIGDEAVGFVSWDPRGGPDRVEMGHNCVASRRKGRGYGTAQMREALRRAFAAGARRVVVTTDELLIPAQRMYRAAGFLPTGRRRRPGPDNFNGDMLDFACLRVREADDTGSPNIRDTEEKSMEKLKIGIIGCGGIANGKHMPALAKLDRVEMTAFCDIVESRAQKAAAEYGAPGAKVFTDYRELLKTDVSVVHVLTPNRQHSFITVDALHAGKHVMCEKPMAINSAEAKKMLDAARETGKKLTIGYQNRFRPECRYLKRLCEAGELGDIYYARAQAVRRRGVPTWGVFLDAENQGGGPLIDIGTHALDLTLWEMNNYEPAMVVGAKFRKLADTKDAANAWGSWDPEKFTVEDSAFGFIRMKNGATVMLESSWALNTLLVTEAKTVLCGDKAGADMLGPEDNPLRINGEKFSRMYTTVPKLQGDGADYFTGDGEGAPAEMEARQWIAHVLDGAPLTTLPEQAYVVTQILEAIYKSAETGEPVYFD